MRKMIEGSSVDDARNQKVIKANEIVRKARYDLPLTSLKALAYIISMVRPTDATSQEYVFSIVDYCRICGIDYANGKNYITVKASLKTLRDQSFWLEQEDGGEVLVGWIERPRIHPRSGKITVELDRDLQKYVIGIYANYTEYELLSTLPMNSKYSFRMFELLKSYAYKGGHTFEIEKLKKQLMAETYVNFKDFRIKVLDIATKEINQYTDLEVKWETKKKGRRVTEVIFRIEKKPPLDRVLASMAATEKLEST